MRKWLHTSITSNTMDPESEKEISKKIEEKIKQFENYGWTLHTYTPAVINEKKIEHYLLFHSDQP